MNKVPLLIYLYTTEAAKNKVRKNYSSNTYKNNIQKFKQRSQKNIDT